MQLSAKQMTTAKHTPMRARAMIATTKAVTTIPMEHSRRQHQSSLFRHSLASSSSDVLSLEHDASVATVVVPSGQEIPVPRQDEPNLFNFPSNLHPTYRPLPILAKIASTVLSIFVAAASTTWPDKIAASWLHPLLALRTNRVKTIQKVLEFALKCVVTGLVTNLAAQEVFLSPSRISTAELASNYFLPCKLSRYEPLPVLPNGENLSVHWLEYHASPSVTPLNASSFPYSALYLNHGFGASSLSWLPAIPSLVEQLGAKVGLGHDAPGFGFTDRPDDISSFTPQASSKIASYLLQSKLQGEQQPLRNESVILFGHSMGSITTLNMALSLPQEIRKQIVLVAPALGISPQSNRVMEVNFPKWSQPAFRLIGKVIVDPPATYLLKRLVGSKNFWKQGLKTVWGNPNRVSDSDALRFQWPSIGLGWEKGLLSFTRAQLTGKADLTDRQLLERVLALPNTRVTVVIGTADKIMPPTAVKRFFKPYESVSIIELEGQGHDPFEEEAEMFVQAVQKALQQQ